MEITSKLWKLGQWVLFLAAMNQLALPATRFLTSNLISKNNISLEEVKKEEYPLKKDMSRVEFLCMARSLVTKAKAGQEKTWRKSICEDYTRATVDMYRHLVKEAGREDLVDKVTLTDGEYKFSDGKRLVHFWLEVEMEDGKIKLFETMRSVKYFLNNKDYADPTRLKPYCNINQKRFNPKGEVQYTWMNETSYGLNYPILESFVYPGGLARMIYLIVSNSDDYMDMYR